jgi:L-asparaginase II
MVDAPEVNPVLAEVVRSGFVESRHRGAVAALAADGRRVIGAGRTAVPFLPRSSNKPLQATAMLRCGLDLDGELFALTLTGLARAFRALVLAAPGTPERRVADAMRAHPEWTSGTDRDERRLMDAVPGLLVKGGAEGVNAFALPDGRAGAVKIDDGAARARTPVTVAVLRLLGGEAGAVDGELATVPVTGGDAVVGTVRAVGF